MNGVNDLCLVHAATGPKMAKDKKKRGTPYSKPATPAWKSNLQNLAGRPGVSEERVEYIKDLYVTVKRKLEVAEAGDDHEAFEKAMMKSDEQFFETSQGFNLVHAKNIIRYYYDAYMAAKHLNAKMLQAVADSRYKNLLKIDAYVYTTEPVPAAFGKTKTYNTNGTLTHIIVHMAERNEEKVDDAIACLKIMHKHAKISFRRVDQDQHVPGVYAKNEKLVNFFVNRGIPRETYIP